MNFEQNRLSNAWPKADHRQFAAHSVPVLGVAVGFVIYAVLMGIIAGIMRAQTGVVLEPFKFNPVMLLSPAMFIALGALAGIVPALKTYRTDVASNLTPHS